MSEISRIDAMGNLKGNSCYECSCASYLGVQGCICKFDCPFRDSINKAISDMEKLEKIEQIFNKTYYNICNSCSDSALIDCKYCEFKMIEQIVKN